MDCPSCGANLPDGVNFCGVCGADLRALVSDSSLAKTVMLDSPVIFGDQGTESEDEEPLATQQEVEALPTKPVMAPVDVNEDALKTAPESVPSANVREIFQKAEQVTDNVAEDKECDMSDKKGQDGDAKAPQDATGNQSGAGAAGQAAGDGDQGGGFRETLWFMQAQDPESLEAIENIDLQARREAYDDDGSALDTSVRKQFSLNPDGKPTQQKAAGGGSGKPGSDEVVHFEEESRNKKLIAGGLVAVICILVAIILMK